MLALRSLSVGIMFFGMLASQPAGAQGREGVTSLTHVVFVTVPARVKVRVSPVSLMARSGLAMSIRANKAWVLSVSAPAVEAKAAKVLWSDTQTGEFTAITATDALLATGSHAPAAVDTTVFFRASESGASVSMPVMLTVSAP